MNFQTKNADGLTYIQISFPKRKSSKKAVIHGDNERTTYVDIDFTRKATPLGDDDNET